MKKILQRPDSVAVYYNDEQIGQISNYKSGTIWEWDQRFSTKGIELSPLALPTSKPFSHHQDEYFSHVPSMLADTLPDNYGMGVMKKHFNKLGITAITPVDKLGYVGDTGIGALRYEPEMLGHGDTVKEIEELRKNSDLLIRQ